jgi:hypothetical protein
VPDDAVPDGEAASTPRAALAVVKGRCGFWPARHHRLSRPIDAPTTFGFTAALE